MATRGTGIVITNEKVYMSPEFNGDMYPQGLGDRFMSMLQNVKSKAEFFVMYENFGVIHFDYDPIDLSIFSSIQS